MTDKIEQKNVVKIYENPTEGPETKGLSKRLCELCGIKPRYGIYVNFGDLDDDYCLVTNERRCRLISDYRYRVEDERVRDLQATFYPDFGQPENFVKLLELKPRKTHKPLFGEVTALVYFFNRTAFVLNCRGDFLKMLIHTINGYSDDFISNSSREKIRRSIREAEWKYE